MKSISDLLSEVNNGRPFKVTPIKRNGSSVMIGFLEPWAEQKDSRSSAVIEEVRRAIVDDERSKGVCIYSAEYWIGDECIERWS